MEIEYKGWQISCTAADTHPDHPHFLTVMRPGFGGINEYLYIDWWDETEHQGIVKGCEVVDSLSFEAPNS